MKGTNTQFAIVTYDGSLPMIYLFHSSKPITLDTITSYLKEIENFVDDIDEIVLVDLPKHSINLDATVGEHYNN